MCLNAHSERMDIPAEIIEIEETARKQGEGIQAVLDRAGIDRSTWTRWKAGTTKPRLESWLAVKVALADRLSA